MKMKFALILLLLVFFAMGYLLAYLKTQRKCDKEYARNVLINGALLKAFSNHIHESMEKGEYSEVEDILKAMELLSKTYYKAGKSLSYNFSSTEKDELEKLYMYARGECDIVNKSKNNEAESK